MVKRGNLNRYQMGRAGREKRLRPAFPNEVNRHLKELRFETFGDGKPDYRVYRGQEVIAYFEAEFPDEGRWPLDGDFVYDTIRWPLRKWEHYCQKGQAGFYNGKPLFMTSIRGDLKDAYYIDALTWCKESQEEYARGYYRGFPKTYPDFGKGLEKLEEYILSRLEAVYGL